MPDRERFISRVSTGPDRVRFAVWLPPGYDPVREWPVILFLHGAGERGSDGLIQTRVGLGPALLAHPERCPAVVLLPQCPAGDYWEGATVDRALACLEEAASDYRLDERRTYLTGISMGGFGTFYLGARHAGRFAALAPICGGGESWMVPALLRTPIWVFHGANDEVVPTEYSRAMVTALKAGGAVEVRYTEYPGVGHNSWDAAYGDANLAAWLLSHTAPG